MNGYTYEARAQYEIEKWKLTPVIKYSGDTDRGACAQGYSKNNYDRFYMMVTKYMCHRRLQFLFLYVVPVHFVSGKDMSVTDTPATFSHVNNTTFNYKVNSEMEIAVRFNFGGGKSVRQYNREMSEEN